MLRSIKLTAYLACLFPALASSGVEADDLPGSTTWYFHADFAEMRASAAGRSLYEWLDAEVFEEIRAGSGVDLGKEADRVTAYSAPNTGAVLVVDGKISQETRDKILAAAAGANRFDTLGSRGKTYYHVLGDLRSENVEIDGVDNEFFFSFDVGDRLIAAAKREQMELLLANGGRIPGNDSPSGGFFVLSADHSLIQAGMKPDGFGNDDGGFKSNILRNTRHVALMIADVAGDIAIEAQLVATGSEMAQSLASVIRGLIALQAFSEDMDPELSAVLRGTRVDVDDERLKISLALSAATISAALDDV